MGKAYLVGGFALPTTSTPTPPFIRDVDNGKRHAQKQSYAIARALSDQLGSAGLSETALWNWVKDCHGVESRSELSELQYVVLSARLSSAQNSPVLFDEMSRQIKLYVRRITGTHNPKKEFSMKPLTSGLDRQQLTCFAILGKDIGVMLLNAGLSERNFWDAVKVEYGVDSRADLSEKDYAQIAARLSAAQKNKDQFDVLCASIRAALGTSLVLVYVQDADGRTKKLYEGPFTPDIEDRCQRYADKTGRPVQFHGTNGADGFKWVEPTANKPAPVPVVPKRRQPAHAFEIHRKGLETHSVEVPFPVDSPDVWKWGQNHADFSGYDVEITNSDKVVIRSFQATPACAPLPGYDSWIADAPEPTNAYCESCGWEYDVSEMHDDNTCKVCRVYEDWIDSDMDSLATVFKKHREGDDSRDWLNSAEALLAQIQQSVDKLRKLG